MKNLQYILCRNCEKFVQLLLNIFFLATASERKCAADIFCVEDCMTASGNISMFFKERVAASKKILRKNDCF